MNAILPLLLSLVDPADAQVPLQTHATLATSFTAERMGGPFGLGVALGAPTGLTGKIWMGDAMAVQFTVGGNLGDFKDVGASVDWVFEFRPINVEGNEYALPFHIGPGLKTDVNFQLPGGFLLLGPRLVAGVTVLVPTLPIDFHVEIAPTVYLIEQMGWDMEGQIGCRYYF
ncbi:MAG: hypothetical protein JXB39_15035 [Deltaproteobacteria bacterium]|nr:hypothetical protein [Deltaproteobacteria bacterium]